MLSPDICLASVFSILQLVPEKPAVPHSQFGWQKTQPRATSGKRPLKLVLPFCAGLSIFLFLKLALTTSLSCKLQHLLALHHSVPCVTSKLSLSYLCLNKANFNEFSQYFCFCQKSCFRHCFLICDQIMLPLLFQFSVALKYFAFSNCQTWSYFNPKIIFSLSWMMCSFLSLKCWLKIQQWKYVQLNVHTV